MFAVVLWKTKTLGFPGPCSGFPFSPPVKFRGLENGVFSFSGILSVLPEIYGICLLKSRPLLLHRHEGHSMDNLKWDDSDNCLLLLWNVLQQMFLK